MKATSRTVLILLLLVTLVGCNTSKQQVLASGSQVEVRSYQTRTYDTDNKIRVLRAVMATLQDLGFVIDKADDVIGIVSATKLQGYALSISVSVRPNGQQMTVRANAQYNLTAVEDPKPYQDFFTSLDKGLFLDDNLYAGSVPTQTPTENSSTGFITREATDVFAYYGEAEQEITDGTYDKDLWARALVTVEGNEQKRKAKYIELRAMELYAADAMSLSTSKKSILPVVASQTAVKQKPAAIEQVNPDRDVSGTYVSQITSDKRKILPDRKLEITLMQKGNSITGTDKSGEAKIRGTIEGDTITYYFLPITMIGLNELNGTWKISTDGTKLEGNWWIDGGGGSAGKWNLTKIR